MERRLREIVYRLSLRPGIVSQRLPLQLAALSPRLTVRTRTAHLGARGDVWRLIDVAGPKADLAKARDAFTAYRAPFVVEKSVLGHDPGRLVLWYKYRPPPRRSGGSHTALAFQMLGRDTVLTDETAGGVLTMRLITGAAARVRSFLKTAREAAAPDFDFELLYVGPPRDAGDARLSADQERALRVARDLGFFGVPRRVGLREVANALGVSASAAGYRLRAAERRLVDDFLGKA